MKKVFALVVTLCLLLSSFAFASAEEKTTLTVWCWDPNFTVYAVNEAAKIYKEINPNVEVVVVEHSSEDCETLATAAFMSGEYDTLPDIISMQDNSGKKFLNTFPDEYYDLADAFNREDFASYKLGNFERDGRSYAVPMDNGVAALFIRTDILAEAGYTIDDVTDITWDELIEIGLDVKEKTGKYILSTQSGYEQFSMMMTQSLGIWFFDEDGNPQLNNPAFKEIVEQIARLAQSGVVYEGVDWSSYIAAFNDGTAAGTAQGCWIIGSIVTAADQSGKWGMTTIPSLNYEGATHYSSQGGSSFVIPAHAKNPELAADFLSKTFAGSVDLFQTILPTSGLITTYLPAADGEAYGVPHEFFGGQKVYEELLEYASKVPMVDYGTYNYEASNAIKNAVASVLNGEDVETALETAQSELEFLMLD